MICDIFARILTTFIANKFNVSFLNQCAAVSTSSDIDSVKLLWSVVTPLFVCVTCTCTSTMYMFMYMYMYVHLYFIQDINRAAVTIQTPRHSTYVHVLGCVVHSQADACTLRLCSTSPTVIERNGHCDVSTCCQQGSCLSTYCN